MPKMKKVLLLDTAFAAAPIYNALVAAGHDVWTTGNRPQDLLARKAGDNWVELNYADVAAVTHIVQALAFDCVVAGCTDVSLETCLAVTPPGQQLDTPDINTLLSDKSAFRQICRDLDLPAPRQVPKNAFPQPGQFICKPVDAFSGKGITVFSGDDMPALAQACQIAQDASRGGRFLIETLADGELYSCSAFIEQQTLKDVFYVLEGSSANPYAVDTSHVIDDLPEDARRELESGLDNLCRALKLHDGLLHTQFILSEGRPYIVELTRRCPGDLYSLLIEYSTGFEYAAKYASYFTGHPYAAQRTHRKHVLRHTVTSIDTDTYEGLRLRTTLWVKAFFPLQLVGQDMLERQRSRVGILFTEAHDVLSLKADFRLFMNREAYNVSW